MKSSNNQTEIAKNFHEFTKHSEISIRTSGHYLDWENKPRQFKNYKGLGKIKLPRNFPVPEDNALASISGHVSNPRKTLNIEDLAEILFLSAGITRKLIIGHEPHYMRAASATGALYPIELYPVIESVAGLDAGVYHFDPFEFSLTQLRKGEFSATLAQDSNNTVASTPATIVFTSLAWRNSWKYQARSYRHWYWDGGVIAANMLAVTSSMGLHAKVITGFVDDTVNRLVGLQNRKEAAIFIIPIGETSKIHLPLVEIGQLDVRSEPLSPSEVEYPEMWKLHEASSLTNHEEVESWLSKSLDRKEEPQSANKFIPLSKQSLSGRNLSETILQRGSTRKFAREPVNFEQLSEILHVSTSKLPVDYSTDTPLLDIFFIANSVTGIASASYQFHTDSHSIEQLKTVESRRTSAYLSLEQPLFGDASVVFYLMADLDQFLSKLGNRGYRIAQLEGGIIAGKIYLASYALGLGASGSTFYDDAVTEFFMPNANGKSPIIEVAVGVPGYKAKPGMILPQFM